ncbi:leucyl/phenylalanyl-tRNA--protein transferase [Thorsellia anophelis]|uniref:Leucyl/phenylalanyl-tRNA--protein transferase n=1 Tax=Thorsellia anophelis DSM 18579 TaxID=1123402 RepID=A0A1I0C1E2_9GAMM|nr:leucyl/phenylalanyl-tRNA--protein transferase [Thorsellia anophelis]SET13294.1 leucyl/phenylalanyl-tRNA--protein transferase [Thorsellia anophelis DSM 18579]
MSNSLTYLDNFTPFPDPSHALVDPNGLLAVGGELSSSRLEEAYQNGIFPWFNEGEPVLWWSPDPRAVLFPSNYQPNKRFKRFFANTAWTVTFDKAFSQVIRHCSIRAEGTWITAEIIKSYEILHSIGLARSVEVWDAERLVGGLYGIKQGALFCGESMFSLESNASKVAFHALVTKFTDCGGELFDCQILNPYTASLGATEISRMEFLSYLHNLKRKQISF